MKIVGQRHEIIYPALPDGWEAECMDIEIAGRTAYRSEEKITDDSWKSFIEMIIKRGHEAVLEFGIMKVKFITDRGISHELVRHRLCSFVQESTRYCNYSKDKFGNELAFIQPTSFCRWTGSQQKMWHDALVDAESKYLTLIKLDSSPQQARSVLPNSLKTEICVSANFREWRHIFRLRAISKAAHPDMRALMIPLYNECRKACPEVFEMGDPE